MARAHVVLPEDIIAEIDRRVGRRKRSEFIADALTRELRRLRRVEVAEEFAGSLRDNDTPGWESSDAVVEWVRALRRSPEDDELVERLRESN